MTGADMGGRVVPYGSLTDLAPRWCPSCANSLRRASNTPGAVGWTILCAQGMMLSFANRLAHDSVAAPLKLQKKTSCLEGNHKRTKTLQPDRHPTLAHNPTLSPRSDLE